MCHLEPLQHMGHTPAKVPVFGVMHCFLHATTQTARAPLISERAKLSSTVNTAVISELLIQDESKDKEQPQLRRYVLSKCHKSNREPGRVKHENKNIKRKENQLIILGVRQPLELKSSSC